MKGVKGVKDASDASRLLYSSHEPLTIGEIFSNILQAVVSCGQYPVEERSHHIISVMECVCLVA